ncbi:MAG TPA: hypothetical protein ENI11_04740 [Actinobacteria bacterium]|nr:hypothetical protein [Actinomycetota bacterium]
MRSLKASILYGLAIWAIAFVVAILISPIRTSDRPFFESIMPVTVALATVLFSYLYFRGVVKSFLSEGVKLGLIWFTINIAIDLPMFSAGPMKMTLIDYVKDIGFTYLIIPIFTIGIGKTLDSRQNSPTPKMEVI